MTEEFPVPSAKKVRVSEDLYAPALQSIQAGEDSDDLYGNQSPIKAQLPASFVSESVDSSSEVEMTAKPQFSLPGLGFAAPSGVEISAASLQTHDIVDSKKKDDQENNVRESPDGTQQVQRPELIPRVLSPRHKNPDAPPDSLQIDGSTELTTGHSDLKTNEDQQDEDRTSEPDTQSADAVKPHSIESPGLAELTRALPPSEVPTTNESKSLEDSRRSNHSLTDQNEQNSKKSVEDEAIGEKGVSVAVRAEPSTGADSGHEKAVDQAEFEYDSSPYENTSDESTTSSEDESEESDEEGYELLDPAEQARRLMEDEGGSEDEGHGKANANGQPRTLNEKAEDVVQIPEIPITQGMRIEELGKVEATIDNMLLIKAKVTGEYQVLESGSLLCLENRVAIGVVAETLGRVQEPLYCVRFTSSESIVEMGLSKGVTIFYVPQYSTLVFTKNLQFVKGSDASNVHDEEVGEDELEFSDDEAEAEYKRMKKLQKQGKRGLRGGSGRGNAHAFEGGSHRQRIQENDVSTLQYEDSVVDDELYTPLTRPSNLNEMSRPDTGSTDYPRETYSRGAHSMRPMRGGGQRDRGFGRGRGDRKSRGNNNSQSQTAPDLRLPSAQGFSRPGNAQPTYMPPGRSLENWQSSFTPQAPYPAQNQFYSGTLQTQVTSYSSNGQNPYPGPSPSWHSSYGSPHVPDSFQSNFPQGLEAQSSSPQNGALPPGAFINPAFFAGYFNNKPR